MKPPMDAPMDTVGPQMGTGSQLQGSPTGAPRKPGFGGMLERIMAQRAMQPGQKQGFGMPMPRIDTAQEQGQRKSVFGQMMGRMGGGPTPDHANRWRGMAGLPPKPPAGPYNAGFGLPPKPPAPPAPPAAPAAPPAPPAFGAPGDRQQF